jgi:hypothetical protein
VKKPKLKPVRFEGTSPDKPHMIVEVRTGQHLAIPPGAKMGIVMDPQKNSPFLRLGLFSVSEKAIVFKCMCNPTCEVYHEYTRQSKGEHTR